MNSLLPNLSDFLELTWVALVVGVIVSIDVTGLILSQYEGYVTKRLTPLRQALLHAGWHSGLFFVYMIAIVVLLKFVDAFALTLPGLMKFLERLIQSIIVDLNLPLGIDLAGYARDMAQLIGILIILFVWLTYSSKISENHEEKYDEDSDSELRFDVQVLVRVVANMPFVTRASQHVLAAAVAVDMLAVSALIKTYLIPQSDTDLPSLQVFGSVIWSIVLFAVFVFIAVLSIAFLGGKAAIWIGSRQAGGLFIWVLVALRILEPFLIFFFLAGAVELLLLAPTPTQLSDDGVLSLLSGTFISGPNAWLSAMLTLSLVMFAGPRQIVANIKAGIQYPDKQQGLSTNDGLIKTAWRHTWPLFIGFVLSMLVVAFANTESFAGPHNLTAVVRFSGLVFGGFATIFAVIVYAIWLCKGVAGQRAKASQRMNAILNRYEIDFLARGLDREGEVGESFTSETATLPEAVYILEAHHKLLLRACGLMLLGLSISSYALFIGRETGDIDYARQSVVAVMTYPFLLGAGLTGLAWLADPRPTPWLWMEGQSRPTFTISTAFACLAIPSGLVLIAEAIGITAGLVTAVILFVFVLFSCLLIERRLRAFNRRLKPALAE